MVVIRGRGGSKGDQMMLVKVYRLPNIRQINSGGLMYSMLIIVTNTVLCAGKLLGE